jgi:hypothetical protein
LPRRTPICRVLVRRLLRIGAGILHDSPERVLLENLYNHPDGRVVRRFDLSLYPPEDHRDVANMQLGLAWMRVQGPMEAISRQEARIACRLRRAEARFDILFRAATAREPVSGDLVAAPAPEAQSAQPVLQNEPNSDPEPAPKLVEPAKPEPAPLVEKPVLQNEPNSQPPVFATPPSPTKPAAPDIPLPNPAQDPETEIA